MARHALALVFALVAIGATGAAPAAAGTSAWR